MSAPRKVRHALTKGGTYNWADATLSLCLIAAALVVFITGMALLFGEAP